MTLRLILITGLLLAGCAHREPGLPTCDGAARRPANPHGSVLVPAPPPSPAADAEAPSPPPGGCA